MRSWANIREARVAALVKAWDRPERRKAMGARSRVLSKAAWADPVKAASIRAKMAVANPSERRSRNGKAMWPKSAKTRSENGTHRDSRGERELSLVLCSVYGDGEVVRNTRVLGCDVDAHVRSIGVCVEYDGVYWHGLDRPYDRLTPHIRRKYDRDRAADTVFAARGARLVRITDIAWEAMNVEERVQWVESLANL